MRQAKDGSQPADPDSSWRSRRGAIGGFALVLAGSGVLAFSLADGGSADDDIVITAATRTEATELVQLEEPNDAQLKRVNEELAFLIDTSLPNWSAGKEIGLGFDDDGKLSGVVAHLHAEEPFTGELLLPAIDRGIDPDGSVALIAYDVVHSVKGLTEIVVSVEFDVGVVWASPKYQADGEFVSANEVGERRRFDRANKPLPKVIEED